jgi:hypothetical protein
MSASGTRTYSGKARSNRLELILLWAEAGPEFREEFQNRFALFERYVESESERLIRSATVRPEAFKA